MTGPGRRIAVAIVLAVLGCLWLGSPAVAELDETLVERLADEGRTWFNRAGDTSLSRTKRNDALKEAYTRLKQARRLLNDHCDEHPGDVERLDNIMVRINQMYFWVKKEAPIGLFSGRPPPVYDPPGRKPRPPTRDPPPPDGGGTPPVAPDPPTKQPEPPAKSPLEIARDHDRTRPSDLGGALELWIDTLASLEDPDSAEYGEALARVAELSEGLKNAYRELRDDDPDSIQIKAEPGKEADIAARLAEGLKSGDAGERKEAAARLGALGYTPAALAVHGALRGEKDASVRDEMFLSLVRLGGRRTCETLAKFVRERREELAAGAVNALAALGRKGRVQARYAGLSLGEFTAKAKQPEVAAAALTALDGLGAERVPGLLSALDTKSKDLEIRAIASLGRAKDPRAAPDLCARLLTKGDEGVRSAAISAIKQIGEAAVPALIAALKTKKTRHYTGIVLYDITGETFGEDARAWAKWWKDRG